MPTLLPCCQGQWAAYQHAEKVGDSGSPARSLRLAKLGGEITFAGAMEKFDLAPLLAQTFVSILGIEPKRSHWGYKEV